MYEIIFSPKFNKQFFKLSKEIQERIGRIFERIRIRPHYFVKRIIGTKHFRLRIGDYRIILEIQNKKLVIYVLEAGYRKNIYK